MTSSALVAPRSEREALLERYGRAYGAERLAVAFTAGVHEESRRSGARLAAGRRRRRSPTPTTARGWSQTAGTQRNPVIVLRPSRLVGLECDTPDDLAAIERLGLAATVTVRSSEPWRRHFYLRPDPALEALPFVAFRFESGRVTADASRYFCAPPSVHPSGRVYAFLPGLAPDEVGFATLPAQVYRQLVARARGSDGETRAQLREDPAAKVLPGRRGDMVFRFACALRR